MTTVGVSTWQHDNPKEMHVPMYSYQLPSIRKVQLAAVKEGIFHPRLPSIRQMDRDNNLHRLPDEHCRTTTTVGPADFRRAKSSVLEPGKIKMHHLPVTEQGRRLLTSGPSIRYQYSPDELKKTREEWSDFLTRCPERFDIRLTEHPDTANTPFTGYAMRYLKPEVTASWRYTLRQEPSLDQFGQKPVPANIYARYRDTHPQYARNISCEAWR